MIDRVSFLLSATLLIAGCGGGDGQAPPASQPSDGPNQPAEERLLVGEFLYEDNSDILRNWYTNPEVDLPRDGQYGLRVERPAQGGAAFPRITFSDTLRNRLEPNWRHDENAEARLELVSRMIWVQANQVYMQWTRHLNYDPGDLTLQVGSHGSLDCHNIGVACYIGDRNAVVLSDDWIAENYETLWRSVGEGDADAYWDVQDHLFIVLTHEAGHQFGYTNRSGTTDGCSQTRCHAPYGSGSVVSYDASRGRSIRYYVTAEDIRHIPNATWKGTYQDPYCVWLTGDPSSIDGWGVYIQHDFEVSGWTAPGRMSVGNLSIVDEISGAGFLVGTPSTNVSLTNSATWSGEDNFLGVEMAPNYLGSLLRADANLRYTFGGRPNLNLRVNNFDIHYVTGGTGGVGATTISPTGGISPTTWTARLAAVQATVSRRSGTPATLGIRPVGLVASCATRNTSMRVHASQKRTRKRNRPSSAKAGRSTHNVERTRHESSNCL